MARSQQQRAPQAPPGENELTPFKVFGMYVDAAKWLLAIIAGLFAFGIESLKDRSGGGIDIWLFVAAAVSLLAAAGLALIYLWQSYSYASHRAGSHRPSADADSAYNSASIIYPFMLGSFALGLVLFALFGAANLQARLSAQKPVTIVAVDGGMIVAQRGHCLWIRDTGAGAQAKWILVPAAGAPKTSGPACQ